MQADLGYERLLELCPETGTWVRPRDRVSLSDSDSLTPEQQVVELLERFGGAKILRGHRVAFTGKLDLASRTVLQQLVERAGGVAERSLTRKTTLLVVGIQNPKALIPGSSASRKMVKARQLREEGLPIRVITEEEFIVQYLNSDS